MVRKRKSSRKKDPPWKNCNSKWGWGKAGTYKGVWCESSWELAYLLYHLDKGVPIRRNRRGFVYTYYGKKHKYYPDFVVDGKYVEIKGKFDKRSRSKIKQFPEELVVIGPDGIAKYLSYARKEYGKDFTRLYRRG